MKPIFKPIRTEPVYREVEEFGRTKLVLMRKEGYIRYTPAHAILVEVNPITLVPPDPTIDLAWDYKIIPADTYVYWEWVKV